MGEILRSEISLFNPEIVVDVRGKGLFTGVTIKEMKGQSVRDITHYKTLPITRHYPLSRSVLYSGFQLCCVNLY